jgi:hypothetical protein
VAVDARTQRMIDKHRGDEARWLQKTQFALGKAKEAREKLAETAGDDLSPLLTLDDGTTVSIHQLDEIIQKRVDALRQALGQAPTG